jgi:hypothetical protein
MVRALRLLISYTRESQYDFLGYVKLIHFSLKEHIFSNQSTSQFKISEHDAHLAMSQTCLIYINYSCQMGSIWEHFEHTKFPLAEYAFDHFGNHVYLAGGDHGDPLQSLLKAFFTFNSVGFKKLLLIQRNQWEGICFDIEKVDLPYPLYHTCKYGFYKTTKLLLEETTKSWLGTTSPQSFPRVTIGGECIAAAASYGHLEVVKLLLENGVEGEPALPSAAMHHHFEIVKLLLENVSMQIGRDKQVPSRQM